MAIILQLICPPEIIQNLSDRRSSISSWISSAVTSNSNIMLALQVSSLKPLLKTIIVGTVLTLYFFLCRLVHIIRAYSIFGNKAKAIEVCVNRFDDETKQAFMELYDKVDADFQMPVDDEVKS